MDLTQDQKTQKLAKWLCYLLGILAIGVLTPLILKGLLGIMGLGAAVIATWVIVMVVTQLLPLGRVMLANAVMKAYQWEAWRNPIETMLNDHMQQSQDLADFNKETNEIEAELGNFTDLVTDAERVAPDSPATQTLRQQREDIAAMVVDMRGDAVEYQRGLNKYAKEIEVAKVIYRASQAGLRIFKKLGFSKKRAYQKIMRETAIASVKNSLNTMRAELNNRRNMARARLAEAMNGDEPTQTALPPKSAVIQTLPATTTQKTRIPR